MATFNNFKNSDNTKLVYLVRLRPYMQVTGWALDSGSVYKAAFAEKAVACRFNVTWQNAAVDRASMVVGDFFWDGATKTLYVWLAGGADPAAGNAFAYFYLYTSTWTGYYDPAKNQWDQIIKEVPTFNRGRESALDRITTSFGQLKFFNPQDFWKDKFNNYLWWNVLVDVRLTGYVTKPNSSEQDWLTWAETQLLMAGVVTSARYADDEIVFDYFDLLKMIEDNFQLAKYDVATYPNLDPNADGQPIHRGYGVLIGITPTEVNITTRQYKFDDQSVTSIDRVWDDTGTLTPSASSTVNATFTLSVAPTGQVHVDYTKTIGSNYPADIMKEILKNVIGLADADLDLPSFTQLNTARTYALGISIATEKPIYDVIEEIKRSSLAEIVTNRAGKLVVQAIKKPSSGDPNIETYTGYSNILKRPEIETLWGNVAANVLVGYARDHSLDGDKQWLFDVTTSAGNKYPGAQNKIIQTAVVSSADASALGLLYKSFHDAPGWRVKIESPVKPLSQFIGQTIKYDRGAEGKGPDGLGIYWKINEISENKNSKTATLLAEQ